MQPSDLFPGSTRLLVLYDGGCPLCRRSCAWLEARDRRGALHCVPLQRPGVLEPFGISHGEAMERLQVVSRTGERRAGADGLLWAVMALPGYRWLAWLLALPGVRPLARAAYGWVSRRRTRDGCTGGRCHTT